MLKGEREEVGERREEGRENEKKDFREVFHFQTSHARQREGRRE